MPTIRRKKASRQQARQAQCPVARKILSPTQIWSGAVAAGQVANLLTAATTCGSARMVRGGRELARVQSAHKLLAFNQPRKRCRPTAWL